jgi:putative ABC transport system ATP-binding protein
VLADEPTASLDTTLANQVVQTFADLIHEQKRIGIMVTHDLRMVRYVDKVIQMVDGKLDRVITDRSEIEEMAGSTYSDHKPVTTQKRDAVPPTTASDLSPAYS